MPKAAPRPKDADESKEIVVSNVTVTRPSGPLLSELAGMDAARAWGENLARDLVDYRADRIDWADMDRGLVLYGPPGTGKTTFAKALAAACNMPMIPTSYADWLRQGAGHQGDVMQAIAGVFDAARLHAPCIVFIDEIDSLPARGSRNQHSDWNNQITNALLAELDGAKPRTGVIVVGACNSIDNIDPALVRPGRLEEFIEIPRPSIEALGHIIRYHLKGDCKRIANLESLAVLCQGKSGAQVEKYVRSARRGARRERRPLAREDIVSAIEADAGKLSPEQERRLAVHEAGHTVCAIKLGLSDNINTSLINRATELNGATSPGFFTQSTLRQTMTALMAGRAAEQVILGEPSAGAGGGMGSDLAQATELAFAAIADYGLAPSSRLIWFGNGSVAQHIHAHSEVGAEMQIMLEEAHDHAVAIVTAARALVELIAAALIKYRALTHAQLQFLASRVVNAPTRPTQ